MFRLQKCKLPIIPMHKDIVCKIIYFTFISGIEYLRLKEIRKYLHKIIFKSDFPLLSEFLSYENFIYHTGILLYKGIFYTFLIQ